MTDDASLQELVARLDTINRTAAPRAKEEALAEVVAMLRRHQARHPAATFDDAIRLVERRGEDMTIESAPEA